MIASHLFLMVEVQAMFVNEFNGHLQCSTKQPAFSKAVTY